LTATSSGAKKGIEKGTGHGFGMCRPHHHHPINIITPSSSSHSVMTLKHNILFSPFNRRRPSFLLELRWRWRWRWQVQCSSTLWGLQDWGHQFEEGH